MGGGQADDPLIRARDDGTRALIETLADPSKLPEIKENIKKTIINIDPSGKMPISDSNAAALASLDESIRKKFLALDPGFGEIENFAAVGYGWRKPEQA